ncbi:MAG TPA: hypothetical protein V6D17_13835 [Candidatus Obscuribacterales bacterium]
MSTPTYGSGGQRPFSVTPMQLVYRETKRRYRAPARNAVVINTHAAGLKANKKPIAGLQHETPVQAGVQGNKTPISSFGTKGRFYKHPCGLV